MNVGSIFRIADAFGVQKLYLTGTTPQPPNRKIRKTSRATEKSVQYQYYGDPMTAVETLRAQGYIIVCLEVCHGSIDIRKYSVLVEDKICLVLGSEKRGVSRMLLDAADHVVHIPMFGQNSSMNVATVCAIATFEIARNYMPSTVAI